MQKIISYLVLVVFVFGMGCSGEKDVSKAPDSKESKDVMASLPEGPLTSPTESESLSEAPTDAAPTDAAPTDAAPTDAAPTDAASNRDEIKSLMSQVVKEPRWLQNQICQGERPKGVKLDKYRKYGWREQKYKGKKGDTMSIWCKPKEYSIGRKKGSKTIKYDKDMIIKEVMSKKFVPDCIKPRAYEKVLRIVNGLDIDINAGACPPGVKCAGSEASTFIDSVIPGVDTNEYGHYIARGIQAWTKFGHCAYKKCSEVGKFDPDTGEKTLCMDERGNVFGPGRDKNGRMTK